MDQKRLRTFLLRVARRAGSQLERRYATFRRREARLKGSHDIVTPADLASEQIIIGEIKKHFPDHQILSEEAGRSRRPDDYLWIVDPLDGTTNFFIHNPLWAVSIALAYRGQLVAGVVHAPLLGETFFAAAGQGAYLNGRRLRLMSDGKRKINAFCHGGGAANIRRALRYHSYQKLHALDCRQMGSAAIEAAYVAAGRLASLLIPGTWPWDVAAGALLVREAGGLVTDFRGREWKVTGRDFLASNREDHAGLLKIIKKVKI